LFKRPRIIIKYLKAGLLNRVIRLKQHYRESVTKFTTMIVTNLVTLKAAAKCKLLFKETNSRVLTRKR